MTKEFPIDIGAFVSFSKTVSESDVYGFAGITGDFAPNHVNEEYMRKSGYGARIAHGALMVVHVDRFISDSRQVRPVNPY